ncbi:MAG: biotin synthase BioB [bacterium]
MKELHLEHVLSLSHTPLCQLLSMANETRVQHIGDRLELCSIINAKSGACGEDCKFCAQSRYHRTHAAIYPLKEPDEIIAHAKKAQKDGAMRYSLVTSGKSPDTKDMKKIIRIIEALKKNTHLRLCASLGIITSDNLCDLKKAGLDRYHHNIETSPEFFPHITTTHKFSDRIDTIKRVKDAGLEACSGGIIGLGENVEDRIKMLICLNDLHVDAIALNILIPIAGTGMENRVPLSAIDVIRTICLYRIASQDTPIIIAAGRLNHYKDFQGLMFLAGANGLMIGNYLTTQGRSKSEDKELIAQIKGLWNG